MSRRAQPYRSSLGTRQPGAALDNMLRGTALGDAFKNKRPAGAPDPGFVAQLVNAGRKPRPARAPRKPRTPR